MRHAKAKHHRFLSGLNIELNGRGSILLNIIIIIVIFASIMSAVVYMSSSGMRQAVSSNQSANAWNLAEAGYRFLSSNYLNTNDSNGNLNADDDKAAFLRNINGRTYVIPDYGSFTITIRPYWFYNMAAATTGNNISVTLPGTAPTNFSMPATGQVKVGDTPGIGVKSYTGGTFNSTTGIFTCTLASNTNLNAGDSVYLVLNPNATQTITPGSDLTLDISNFSAGAFPSKDGLIEIGTETRLYRYSKATLPTGSTVLTLSNLQHSDKSTFSKTVTGGSTGTPVTFKKYIVTQSRGQVGPEQRTLTFNQAITDSVASLPPVLVKLDNVNDLNANFSRSSSVTDYTVANLQTSGGGSAAFSIINSLSADTNGNKCGAFWYSGYNSPSPAFNTNTQWTSSNNLLSYEVQVKVGTGNALTNGTAGLAIRAKKVSSSEPDTYLGITFMKYNLPSLYFNRQTGTMPFNPGDTVYGESSHQTGVVQGTPEITSGSWAGGNAAGKIRFASMTGAFSNDEWLRLNNATGNRIARVDGNNYFPAATDYIPDTIKPKPSNFSPARYNIGPLLLVLWERKVDGTYRWLAFKDISNDDYAKGLQDWNNPEGSCNTSAPCSYSSCQCPESDGQIVNDNASIYVRVQERKVVFGSGAAVKVNDINLFYGDASSRYTTPARPGNSNAYDIKELRKLYALGSPFVPVWVPQYLNQWEQSVDYFSHLESGTPIGSQPQFQWDAINPNVTGIILRICDDASVYCTSAAEGTLRLTELVTPDSGTYSHPEIGLLGCGGVTTNPYSTAAFAEFALKPASAAGYLAGGFLGSSLSW